MKKIFGCLFAAMAIAQFSSAQTTRYIVKFKNKGNNPYALNAPAAYLSQASIDRRTKYSIAIDSTDLPVTPRYVDSVRLAGTVTILNVSKWLNSVSFQTSDPVALSKINSLTFVQSVTGIAAKTNVAGEEKNKFFESGNELTLPAQRETDITADFFNYGSSFDQIHIHNGEFLHNIGLRGQNMVIGMFDGGFQNYLTVKVFDSVRNNNQILGIYDFVAHDNSVNEDADHGMECLSTIAANIPGQFVGTAPKANFYLFRSEDVSSEYQIEEHNWVCAAERLDSLGGDVISSSLGYGDQMSDPSFNHTYAEMNGNTTMAAIGADLAAKKGMLVVNSAGNEGTNSWHYIITPADGDSVMAVGAVNSAGAVASFSSYGPSSDGQIKPDVASVGANATVGFPNNTIGTNSGTSFSAPNMAGLTTCLWQGFREFNNMTIIHALQQSGNISSAPNDRIGYGIPDVKKATMKLLKDFANSSGVINNCRTTLSWTSKDMSAMKYEIERKLPGQSSYTKIAEQQGTGVIFNNHSYSYDDVLTGVTPGTISYRIRQIIDTSGAGFMADYIDTATVNLTAACTATGITPVNNETLISLIPNPARDQFVLRISSPDAVQNLIISMYNSKGQLISLSQKTKASGTTDIQMSSVNLPAGKYYITIYSGTKLMAAKELIKL